MTSDRPSFPWPPQSATGMGSMPGTDEAEAIALVLDELPELPYLPELPARGPGADLIGRTAGLLVDMPVQTTPRGWQLATRPGGDLRRARDLMSADLDALEAAAEGYTGCFKIQACGPWTLAAGMELHSSAEPALADPGAVADLVASLAEGLAAHVTQVGRRLPGATLLVQLDEPSLPAVLAGSVPTASGLYLLPPVEESVACDNLGSVLAAASAPTVVHCCSPETPFSCLTSSGATALSFDLDLLRREAEDAVGEAVESGLGVFVEAVPSLAEMTSADSDSDPAARQTAAAVIKLWRRIGLPASALGEQVVVTPACGLAGATPTWARAALARCRAAARLIPELIEEGSL